MILLNCCVFDEYSLDFHSYFHSTLFFDESFHFVPSDLDPRSAPAITKCNFGDKIEVFSIPHFTKIQRVLWCAPTRDAHRSTA